MLWKCCTWYTDKFGKLSSDHGTGKGQFSFQSQRRAMPKNVQTYIVLISHTSKIMLKISKLAFNSTWTENFQKFKLDLEKAEEPEIKLSTSVGSSKKRESSRKTSTSASLTTLKLLTVWVTTNCGKFLKRWEYQITLSASWEICIEVKKQQIEPDIEQIGSNLGKEYVKGVYFHPTYLI